MLRLETREFGDGIVGQDGIGAPRCPRGVFLAVRFCSGSRQTFDSGVNRVWLEKAIKKGGGTEKDFFR